VLAPEDKKVDKVSKAWVVDQSKVIIVTTNRIWLYNYADLSEAPKEITRDTFLDKGSFVDAANSCFKQSDATSFEFWLSVAIGTKDIAAFKASEPAAERDS